MPVEVAATLLDVSPEDTSQLRGVYGCFPSGVTALCAEIGGGATGIVASSFTSVSLSPPLVSVCIQNSSKTWPRLRAVPRLGVSVLAATQEGVCRSLSRQDGDRFAHVRRLHSDQGAIFVDDAVAMLECSVYAELPAGDHTIALLRIHRTHSDAEASPLVFHRSTFRRLADD